MGEKGQCSVSGRRDPKGPLCPLPPFCIPEESRGNLATLENEALCFSPGVGVRGVCALSNLSQRQRAGGGA